MAAHFGSRLRKSAMTTTVAAVAVAALSASQAPGVTTGPDGRQATADSASSGSDSGSDSGADDTASGNSRYYTDLPPLDSPLPAPSSSAIGTPVTQGSAASGIPATVLDAYQRAEASLRASKPGCNLPWQLLAAIGKVESGQARGGAVTADGTTTSRILGPQLDGNGFALIKDTDNGAYDGNSSYDQAVGPMQFIPSTWAWAGRDGNDDGTSDPNNIYDAALAAGHYLCRFGWDLSDQGDLDAAILSYNNSQEYLDTVLSWLEYYRKGTYEIPDGTGTLPVSTSDGSTASGTGTASAGGASTSPRGQGDGGGSSAGTKSPTAPSTPTPTPPGTQKPAPEKPSQPPQTTEPPQTPTDTVARLENADTGKLTAMAGDTFAERISTRAETKAGQAVGKVRVRFTLVGENDTAFSTGERVATVLTDASGVATAPALRAGEQTGDLTVRVTVVGRTAPVLDYRATVTERVADTVVLTDATPDFTCVPGGTFADRVAVRATYQDAAADRVAVTATLVTSATDAAENDKGPYFKDADGKAVRTLTELKTDADGLLELPPLYADDTAGSYILRITTAGGAVLDVDLTVESVPTASPTPSDSTSTAPAA